jgi:hypothetical protein
MRRYDMHVNSLRFPHSVSLALGFAAVLTTALGYAHPAQATVTCYMVTSSGATLSLESLCGPNVSVGAYLHTPPVPADPPPVPEASFTESTFGSTSGRTSTRQRNPELELPNLSQHPSAFRGNPSLSNNLAIPALMAP